MVEKLRYLSVNLYLETSGKVSYANDKLIKAFNRHWNENKGLK